MRSPARSTPDLDRHLDGSNPHPGVSDNPFRNTSGVRLQRHRSGVVQVTPNPQVPSLEREGTCTLVIKEASVEWCPS